MYLNVNTKLAFVEHLRLTLTLDVFKSQKHYKIKRKLRGLTLTLDVFKYKTLGEFNTTLKGLTLTLDVFK